MRSLAPLRLTDPIDLCVSLDSDSRYKKGGNKWQHTLCMLDWLARGSLDLCLAPETTSGCLFRCAGLAEKTVSYRSIRGDVMMGLPVGCIRDTGLGRLGTGHCETTGLG